MNLNLPNILTLLRILLIPVLILVFYYPVEWANIAATAIFLLPLLQIGLMATWLVNWE